MFNIKNLIIFIKCEIKVKKKKFKGEKKQFKIKMLTHSVVLHIVFYFRFKRC